MPKRQSNLHQPFLVYTPENRPDQLDNNIGTPPGGLGWFMKMRSTLGLLGKFLTAGYALGLYSGTQWNTDSLPR